MSKHAPGGASKQALHSLVLYPLLQTVRGLVPGEFEQATVHFENGVTRIECPDTALRARLRAIFSTPLRVRRAVGTSSAVIAWEVHQVEPDSEAFFEEIRHHLHRHYLAAR